MERRYNLCLTQEYPDLFSVAASLFPESNPERLSIQDYKNALELRGRLTPPVQEAIKKAKGRRNKTKAIVYIAGPLTGMDEKTKTRYGMTSKLLAGYNGKDQDRDLFFGYVPHLHGTDPVKHQNVTPEEVRDIDYLWSSLIADMQLNFVHPIAQGNAIEEGWAERTMIPTVYLSPTGTKLSRLTLGMNNVVEHIDYKDFSFDGLKRLKLFFDEYEAWLNRFPDHDPREYFYLSYSVLRNPGLIQNGINTDRFSPVFHTGNFLVYVKDASNPRYGQVGELTAHDWKESGDLHIRFDGEENCVPDDYLGLSYWINLDNISP